MSKPNPSTNTAATIPSYQDIAQATFGTLWPEATPQDWALVVHKLREALQAGSNGPSEGACAKAIREHNEGCDGACEGRRPTAKDDSGGCGYQRSDGSLIYSRRCPECPKDWKIEVPASEAGAERDPNDPDPVEHARELAAALIEARKELVEIRPEAARYRWLRERPFGADFEHSSIEKGAGWALIFCMPEGSTISANLDKSLDEAMASSNERTKP